MGHEPAFDGSAIVASLATIDTSTDGLETQLTALTTALTTLTEVISPTGSQSEFDRVTIAAGWDMGNASSGPGGSINLGLNTVFVDVGVTADCYIIIDSNSASPSAGTYPAWYAGGLSHRIPCRNGDYLHYRRRTATDVTINVTARKRTV